MCAASWANTGTTTTLKKTAHEEEEKAYYTHMLARQLVQIKFWTNKKNYCCY